MPYNQIILELQETIRWMAQTVHQAHHQHIQGTFMECPKSLCREAKRKVEMRLSDKDVVIKRTTDWYWQ